MGYKKAEEILPMETIKLIQKYVDGENIYIPRKEEQRMEWEREHLYVKNWKIGICRYLLIFKVVIKFRI